MIELAWTVIEEAQYMFGGMVTFLEAENEEKLLSFTGVTVSHSLTPDRLYQEQMGR